MPLPPGLTIINSIAITHPDGMQQGACILRNAGNTEFWATDYWCGPGQDPNAYAAVFGPHASESGARSECDGGIIQEMDANGTPGSSTWLDYP